MAAEREATAIGNLQGLRSLVRPLFVTLLWKDVEEVG